MRKILKRSHQAYLSIMAIVALPVAVIFGLNGFILYKTGEMELQTSIARDLQRQDMIYGTGVHDVRKTLPLNILKERKPAIVAMGSSRPLDFRQEYFIKPFSCACQAMSQIDDGLVYAQALLDAHVPEVVIFALDFWWFQADVETKPPPLDYAHGPHLNLHKLLKPLLLIFDGTLSVGEYFNLLTKGEMPDAVGKPEKSGLLAKIRGLGLRRDSSLFFGPRLTDYGFEYYEEFAADFAEPESYIASSDRYGPDLRINGERIETLRRIVALFHEKDVKVVLVLPPIAPPIYQAFDLATTHKRFKDLPERLKGIGDEFYDFHDPRKIGTNACEFADPHHAGDTAYMRILQEILRQNPVSVIQNYVDREILTDYIARYSGLTMADFDNEHGGARERDFLRLGCAKKKAYIR